MVTLAQRAAAGDEAAWAALWSELAPQVRAWVAAPGFPGASDDAAREDLVLCAWERLVAGDYAQLRAFLADDAARSRGLSAWARDLVAELGLARAGGAGRLTTIAARSPAGCAAEVEGLARVDRAVYQVERELARGGMGRVSAARDRRLGRRVAIKEIAARADADPATSRMLRARLEREALITARLSHPSIVSVYEAGRWPSGEPFVAMEHVRGEPLDRIIARADTLAERLALLPHVIAVADAVAYAHANRIIHRDLKPANVLVGEFGETVVIDWGLARDLAEPRATEVSGGAPYRGDGPAPLTHVGQVMGTPAYMSPEQARGHDTDERTDVYALGAMLYHVLTGAPPYDGLSAEIISSVKARPPRAVRAREPGAPRELAAIAERALQHVAERRYRTARELAEDLKRFAAGKLVAAHSYGPLARALHWARHRRVSAAVAVALAVALLGVGGVSGARIVSDRARLIDHNDELVLAHARAAMFDDPAAALEWIGQLERPRAEGRRLAAEARELGVPVAIARGSSAPVTQTAVAGDLIATADVTGEVRVWSPDGSSRVVAELPPPVYELAFDDRADRLAVAGPAGVSIARVDRTAALERAWDGVAYTVAFGGDDLFVGSHGALVRAAGGADHTLLQVDGEPAEASAPLTTTLMMTADRQVFAAVSGGRIAAVTGDGRVALLGNGGGAQWSFDHPAGMPLAVAVSPVAGVAATLGRDGIVRLWTEAGATALGEPGAYLSLAFAPDGAHVAAGSAANGPRLWRVADGAPVELDGATGAVGAIAFAPDGERLAWTSSDGDVFVHGVDGGEQWRLRGHRGAVHALAFFGGGGLLSLDELGVARVWQPYPRARLTLPGHGAVVFNVSVAGGVTATSGRDGDVVVTDATRGASRRLRGHEHGAVRVRVSPDGRYVATQSATQRCRVWSVADGAAVDVPGAAPCAVWLGFSAGAFAALDDHGIVRVTRLPGGQWRELPADGAVAAGFAPDGALLTAHGNGDVARWTDGERVVLRSIGEPVQRAVWSTDGSVAAFLTPTRLIVGRHALPRPDADAINFSLAPDGSGAALWSDRGVELLDARTGATRRLPYAVSWVAVAPDFTSVAVAERGARDLLLCDPRRAGCRTLRGHRAPVFGGALAFAPTGVLVSGDNEGVVRQWTINPVATEEQAP